MEYFLGFKIGIGKAFLFLYTGTEGGYEKDYRIYFYLYSSKSERQDRPLPGPGFRL